MGIKDWFITQAPKNDMKFPAFHYRSEQLKTITKDSDKTNTGFTKKLGTPHPFDAVLVENMYKQIGLVTGIVDKFVTRIVGGGFHVTSPTNNKKSVQLITDWVRDTQFQVMLEDWVREACIKPGGYLELGGKKNEVIKQVKIIDGTTVYVQRDNKGKIEKYNQYLGTVGREQKIIPLEPWQVAALHFRQVGDDAYGQGLIWPVRYIIDRLIGMQTDMHTLIHRKANAPLHVKIGSLDGEGAFIPTQDVIDEYANKLYLLTDKTEFVTDPYFEFNVIDFGQIGEKFDAILQHDIDMLVFSTQIPEVLLGKGSIPEGLAKVQDEDFMRYIQSFQARIEKVLEEQVFSRILLSNGINDKVEVQWGQPSDSERNEKIQRLKDLLTLPTLDSGLRTEIEKDLAITLGYDSSVIVGDSALQGIMSEPVRDEFEKETEQPLIPGENNQFGSKKHVHEGFDYSLDKDYTLREWLDFDYKKYLEEIKRVIDRESFDLLRATNDLEISAGLLREEQLTELRTVFKEGFDNEKTLQEIATDIEGRVKPGPRYSIDGNKLGGLRVPADKRSMLIARSESTRLAGEGARTRYEDSGIKEYSVLAASSACELCQEQNGVVMSISTPTPVPLHANCRCTVVPVINE